MDMDCFAELEHILKRKKHLKPFLVAVQLAPRSGEMSCAQQTGDSNELKT